MSSQKRESEGGGDEPSKKVATGTDGGGPGSNGAASTQGGDDLLAFAVKNRKKRFFIPSKGNSFGGIPYENVMIDNGCSSVLLPFPANGIQDLLDQEFNNDRWAWTVFNSKGTGAVHSPVLKIKSRIGRQHDIVLKNKTQPVKLNFLRFHLGSVASDELLASPVLDESEKTKLRSFQDSLGGEVALERHHVLLGQSYIDQVFSAQVEDVAIFVHKGHWESHVANLADILAHCHVVAGPLVDSFDGFHDLEDEDHNGDADEDDARLSWEPDEETDELFT